MISYLGCDAAREMLQAFVDRELPMVDQVGLSPPALVRYVLGTVEDLRTIGTGIRLCAAVPGLHAEDPRALAVIQSEVLTRIRAERDQSLSVWCRDLFADMRFLWPAIGATAAVAMCLFAMTSVNRVARAEHPYSMADRISTLANPGSDRNPLQLDSRMLAPRPLDHGLSLDLLPAEEVVFALAAVVTREGRVANFELLGPDESAHVRPLLEAVKESRFTPARTSDGAVAVRGLAVDPYDGEGLDSTRMTRRSGAARGARTRRRRRRPASASEGRPRRAPRPARS